MILPFCMTADEVALAESLGCRMLNALVGLVLQAERQGQRAAALDAHDPSRLPLRLP